MKTFIFRQNQELDANQTTWNCQIDGDFTALNALKVKEVLNGLIDDAQTQVNLKLAANADFDLTALNAIISSHRIATKRGSKINFEYTGNVEAKRLMAYTHFDRILLN